MQMIKKNEIIISGLKMEEKMQKQVKVKFKTKDFKNKKLHCENI